MIIFKNPDVRHSLILNFIYFNYLYQKDYKFDRVVNLRDILVSWYLMFPFCIDYNSDYSIDR